jgi:hypothetical protein
MGKKRIESKMSGYELPIQDDNEREYYAKIGRIQEREAVIKILKANGFVDAVKLIEEREYTWNYS